MVISTPKRIFTTSRQIIARWLEEKQFDPRAHPIDMWSTALAIRKRFFVYMPPGYATGRKPLPVLYLFRGHEHEWINGAQDASRQGHTVIDVYEELLEASAVGPMNLVFPGISSDDNSIPGLLVNFKQPQLAKKSGIGSGRFEDYLMRDIIPYVDRYLRAKPGARGTDGFSLGGFMAITIAAWYPAMFRTVGAFDGLYFWDDPVDAHAIAQSDAIFRNPMFDPAIRRRT